MRVVALCGSLRSTSVTRLALSITLAAAAESGAEIGFVEIDGLPWCDGREAEAYGERVARLRAELKAADAIVIGSPEYHGSTSGVLKNALDLLEGDDLRGKLVGLVASARGDAGAMNTLNHLRQVSRWVNAWVLPMQVSIPRAGEVFGPEGGARRAALEAELRELGRELVRFGSLLAQK